MGENFGGQKAWFIERCCRPLPRFKRRMPATRAVRRSQLFQAVSHATSPFPPSCRPRRVMTACQVDVHINASGLLLPRLYSQTHWCEMRAITMMRANADRSPDGFIDENKESLAFANGAWAFLLGYQTQCNASRRQCAQFVAFLKSVAFILLGNVARWSAA